MLGRTGVAVCAYRLAALLAEHAAADRPRVHALLALMLLNGARHVPPLAIHRRRRSRRVSSLSRHRGVPLRRDGLRIHGLAAHIVALRSPGRIGRLPVVALNRAVAVAHVHGPRAGIKAVATIHDRQQLNCYYLLYAVLGEFEADLDHRQAAMKHFRKALELTTIKSEQTFFTKKLRELNIAYANGARRAHQRSEHS